LLQELKCVPPCFPPFLPPSFLTLVLLLSYCASHSPIHAFIFLFKWVGHGDPTKMDGKLEEPVGSHYFAHQVINNACASIALLNAVMNIQDPNVQLGEELSNLREFSDGKQSLASLTLFPFCSLTKLFFGCRSRRRNSRMDNLELGKDSRRYVASSLLLPSSLRN
jgi:hypothetical protein